LSDVARLLISCPDRPGIVAAVSQFLFEHSANIIHSDQHSSEQGQGAFFMRIEFALSGLDPSEFRPEFAVIAQRFGMDWRLTETARPHRLAIFVSRQDHALVELLWQRAAGDLQAEIALVISNHTNNERLVAEAGIPFFHVPMSPTLKPAAEARELDLLSEYQVDTVVLARYMQVLSSEFLARFPAAIINIHHSFLPAFVGANPYEAAYTRGVKLIGATAHYVSEELDAGPIIEQDVHRVDHRHGPADLRRMGRYIERVVLARAVTWHVEDRVLLHGNKTIVFS